MAMTTDLAPDFRVIDADTHFTEPFDLWTKRAPAEYKDRILHIEEREGGPTWIVDGVSLGFARGGGVVDREGEKAPFVESMQWGYDRVHQGAWDPEVRLQVMDQCGIHAQVLFPSAIGLGGHYINNNVTDPVIKQLDDDRPRAGFQPAVLPVSARPVAARRDDGTTDNTDAAAQEEGTAGSLADARALASRVSLPLCLST